MTKFMRNSRAVPWELIRHGTSNLGHDLRYDNYGATKKVMLIITFSVIFEHKPHAHSYNRQICDNNTQLDGVLRRTK